MKTKRNVLVYHPTLLDVYLDLLHAQCSDLALLPARTAEAAKGVIAGADIMFASVDFPSALLKKAQKLRWIQTMGAGVEKFVLSNAIPKDVILSRVKGTFGPRMAEYVLAQMLFDTQKIEQGLKQQQNCQWQLYFPEVLYEKTLGVAGLGAIGSEVARKAAAIGMKVYGFDLNPAELPFLDAVYGSGEIETFVKNVDFLAICMPYTSSTKGMFNKNLFKHMKQSARIINISRGALIDETDLLAYIKDGKLGGAILDTFSDEPLPSQSAFWLTPGIRVTPHMAGPSLPTETVEVFVENLKRFEKGEPLLNVVDLQRQF